MRQTQKKLYVHYRRPAPLDGSVKICPLCNVLAVEELSAALKRVQPDGTTHVCHPQYGGCNHGFAVDGGGQ